MSLTEHASREAPSHRTLKPPKLTYARVCDRAVSSCSRKIEVARAGTADLHVAEGLGWSDRYEMKQR